MSDDVRIRTNLRARPEGDTLQEGVASLIGPVAQEATLLALVNDHTSRSAISLLVDRGCVAEGNYDASICNRLALACVAAHPRNIIGIAFDIRCAKYSRKGNEHDNEDQHFDSTHHTASSCSK